MKRKLRQLWRRLCAGIVASGKLQDTIHGKRDKYGPTIKSTVCAAVVATAVSTAQAGDKSDRMSWLFNLLDAVSGKSAGEVAASAGGDIKSPSDAGQVAVNINGLGTYGGGTYANGFAGQIGSNYSNPGYSCQYAGGFGGTSGATWKLKN